jgi:hypothetical protein
MDQALVDDDFDAATQEFEQDEEAECERGGDSGHQMDMGQKYRLHQSLMSRGHQLLYILYEICYVFGCSFYRYLALQFLLVDGCKTFSASLHLLTETSQGPFFKSSSFSFLKFLLTIFSFSSNNKAFIQTSLSYLRKPGEAHITICNRKLQANMKGRTKTNVKRKESLIVAC